MPSVGLALASPARSGTKLCLRLRLANRKVPAASQPPGGTFADRFYKI